MIQKIRSLFQSFFSSSVINKAAADSGLVERRRKIEAEALVTTLAFWNSPSISYANIASELCAISGEKQISTEAVRKKIQKSSQFFEAFTLEAIKKIRNIDLPKVVDIKGVGDVFVADSSGIKLNPALASFFPGSGGSASDAAIKLHVTCNLTRQTIAHLAISDGKTSDHDFDVVHKSLAKPGDLIVRDLGYFRTDDLASLTSKGVFFVSRVPLTLKYFFDISGGSFDLWGLLANLKKDFFEKNLLVSIKRLSARIFAARLPEEKRIERELEAEKKKKSPLTELERTQAAWNLYITNLSPEQASVGLMLKLYAMRWQIELFFKACKSSMGIHKVTQASSANVVTSLIWARLLYAVLMMVVLSIAQSAISCEIGIIRWFNRLTTHLGRIAECINRRRWRAIAKIIQNLVVPFTILEKAKRRTSRRKLLDLQIVERGAI